MSNDPQIQPDSPPRKNGNPAGLSGRRVYTYAPMQEGRLFIAQIHGAPFVFKGRTAMAAVKRARQFAAAIDEKRLMEGDPEKDEGDE